MNGIEQKALSDIHDVIGVGIGPANLALAVALEEERAETVGGGALRSVFFDSKPEPSWHSGMLLEDALLQVSVLKDIATLRNPCSRYTFLNYLKSKGRLLEFLNLRDNFPTRIEFNDYLCWVAEHFRDRLRYGWRVTAITPVEQEGAIPLLRIECENLAGTERQTQLTRNVVLATGSVPSVPAGVALSPGGRAFHSSESMHRLTRDYPDKNAPYRFIVVGAGQSGAELFHYLMNHYPNADITAAIRRFAYKPVDDSDFTNEIFFPGMVDFLYGLPDAQRAMVLDHCKEVNYAVVDLPLIRRIYRSLYNEKVMGKTRARVRGLLKLENLMESGDSVIARFRDLAHDQPVTLKADGLIMCTGYSWHMEHPLLAQCKSFIKSANGRYQIDRNYRLVTDREFSPGIFMQGFAEPTHGASETVLSLVSVRAGDIVKSLSMKSSTDDAVFRSARTGS